MFTKSLRRANVSSEFISVKIMEKIKHNDCHNDIITVIYCNNNSFCCVQSYVITVW